jgi:hypothetical protein
MNTEETTFTIQDAIKYQFNQLRNLRKILTPEAYGALELYAEKNNRTAKDPKEIIRGSDLDVFLSNYSRSVKPLPTLDVMTLMTAEDLRSLRFGDKVYYGTGESLRGLRYVGRMPSSENYLIFSDGEFLMHLYIGTGDKFRGDWFMGEYNSEFAGNYLKKWHLDRIEGIDRIYLKKDKK